MRKMDNNWANLLVNALIKDLWNTYEKKRCAVEVHGNQKRHIN